MNMLCNNQTERIDNQMHVLLLQRNGLEHMTPPGTVYLFTWQ